MPHKSWDELKDNLFGLPGTPKRIQHEADVRKLIEKDRRLDRIFGWMLHIPPRFPKDLDENGYDFNRWKGLGPLMYLVWRTWADEGFYGMLDMLTFHYFEDKYVLKFKDIRQNRTDARKWRDSQKEK